jgi:drug/metabolite transporter (DMT)-like permease
MWALGMSILTNAGIYILFKWFEKNNTQIFHAIVVNYIVAFSIGIWMVPDMSLAVGGASDFPNWFIAALLLGVLFIYIFNLAAQTALKSGVTVTTVASKMSLALAVLLFVYTDPNEHITGMEGIAILLALCGVIFTSSKGEKLSVSWSTLVGPILILLGGTVIDFSIAHFATHPSNSSEMALYSCLSFGVAGLIGSVIILYRIVILKIVPNTKDLFSGIMLGVVNYGSIYFLVIAYNSGVMEKSTLLPLNNLGVVIVSALGAVIIFKEKLSRPNWMGLALSLLALALLMLEHG